MLIATINGYPARQPVKVPFLKIEDSSVVVLALKLHGAFPSVKS
jgi:hypothetical protein